MTVYHETDSNENDQLVALAAQIRAAHSAVGAAGRTLLEQARECGERIREAKELLPHGQFGRWLAANCNEISERQAQRYMRIAVCWAVLAANPTRASEMSIRGACRFLDARRKKWREKERRAIAPAAPPAPPARPEPPAPPARPEPTAPPAQRDEPTWLPATAWDLSSDSLVRDEFFAPREQPDPLRAVLDRLDDALAAAIAALERDDPTGSGRLVSLGRLMLDQISAYRASL